MNKPVPERETKTAQRLGFVDCDLHPVQRTPKDLSPTFRRGGASTPRALAATFAPASSANCRFRA